MSGAGTSPGPGAADGRATAGLLPIDKPVGVTSHDVVDRARVALGQRAIGHLGTLDPGASGLLVLAVGAATRCASVWQSGGKTYEGTIRFGVTTDTQDLQGRVLEQRPVAFDEARLREASRAFVGDLQQVPPMVSAIKHHGRRLYKLARRGEVVHRDPRPVNVTSWAWRSIELPIATFEIRCSGGTYVRTLAHDLGEALGSGAALAALRRTASEPFTLENAARWEDLRALPAGELWERHGIALDRALDRLPSVVLDAEAVERLGRGGRARVEPPVGAPLAGGERSVVFRDAAGHALALGELSPDPADASRIEARPHVVFPWAVREGRPA